LARGESLQQPAMSARLTAAEANRRYFREAYRTGQHGWGVQEPSAYALNCLEQVKAQAGPGRLLDLGCGEGRHSLAAAPIGFQVVGVDYEPLAIERARHFARTVGAEGIHFLVADILALPFPADCFDVVLDYGCLHHQRKRDWPAYKRSLLRVLRPQGFYILQVFGPDFRLFGGSSRKWHLAYGSYRRYFTQDDLRSLFDDDFEVLTLEEEPGPDGGFWHALMQRRAT